MAVNHSFQLQFVILSFEHAEDRISNGTLDPSLTLKDRDDMRPPGIYDHRTRQGYVLPDFEEAADDRPTGAASSSGDAPPAASARDKPRKTFLLRAPVGTTEDPVAFKNSCLLVSLVLGKWNALTDSLTRSQKSFINYPWRSLNASLLLTKTALGERLQLEINQLASDLGISRQGPHLNRNTIIEQTAALWKCQIFVWVESHPAEVNFVSPKKWDFSLPQINILLTMKGELEANDHVDIIRNVTLFWRRNGLLCPACSKPARNFRNVRHKCSVIESCFACHKFVKTGKLNILEANKHLFCDAEDRNVSRDFKQACLKCQTGFYSENCKLSHNASICLSKGYFCPLCKTFRKGIPAKVKERHKCHSGTICRECWTNQDKNHQCKWSPPRLPIEFVNLGFIHFKTTSSQSRCADCFQAEVDKEKESLCPLHKELGTEKGEEVMFCAASVEDGQRQQFNTFCLQHPKFDKPNFTGKTEVEPYLPTLLRKDMTKLHLKRPLGRYGRPVPRCPLQARNLAILRKKQNKTVVENLIAKLVGDQFMNYTFVLSTESHLQHLVTALVINNIIINDIIYKGSTVLMIPIAQFGIKFISMSSFVDASFSDLKKQFCLDQLPRPFLPQALNNELLFGTTHSHAPPLSYYLDTTDTRDVDLEKRTYYKTIQDEPFSFQDCVENVCLAELSIHLKACISLLKASFTFQDECYRVFGRPDLLTDKNAERLHMFDYISLGSFIHTCFRLYSLGSNNPLYSVMPEPTYNCSKPELEYLAYLHHRFPGEYISALSSNDGPRRITKPGMPTVIPDAFGRLNQRGRLHFFNGEHYHGCIHADCPYASKEKNRKEMEEKFQAQLNLLVEEHGYNPDNITVVYFCEWEKQRLLPEIANFLASVPPRPQTRLKPQLAVKSALTDAFTLKWPCSEAAATEWEAQASDVASLFPFVALTCKFPIGKCIKLVSEDIVASKVSFSDQEFFYDSKPYMGLMQVTILPPSGLEYPLLQNKINGQTLMVLCRTCAEKRQEKGCEHKDIDRMLTDVYTTTELAFCVTVLHYRIISYHELMLYAESAPILEQYTALISYEKIRHSPLPPMLNLDSEDELKKYCDDINQDMKFLERIGKDLTPKDLSPNAGMRMFFKHSLVKYIGMFSTNMQKRSVCRFLQSPDALHYYSSRGKVLDVCPINDRFIQVAMTSNKFDCDEAAEKNGNRKISRTSNAVIGALITSTARVVVYKTMMKLVEKGAQLLKVNCDAIYFALPTGMKDPLKYSQAFGRWQHCYPGRLKSICQTSVNSYGVQYLKEGTQELVTSVKCSGLSIKHRVARDIDISTLSEALDIILARKLAPSARKWFSVRKVTNAKGNMSIVRTKRRAFSSTNILNRRVVNNKNFSTTPYGFKK